jgi:excisionase family DNA binding protein
MQIQFITTEEELQSVMDRAVQKAMGVTQQTPSKDLQPVKTELIRGISELAKILKCTYPTAQKLKNSGKIPFYQDGRTLLFKTDEVLKAIQTLPKKTA